LRICVAALFLQDHLGGIGVYTRELVRHLLPLDGDLEIDILTHAGIASGFGFDDPRVRIIALWPRKRWIKLIYWHFIFPFRARKYELVHAVGNMGFLWGKTAQVITIHDAYEKVSPDRFSWLKRSMMGFAINRSGKKARAIIAVSRNTAGDVRKFYPALAGKVSVIYSGGRFSGQGAPMPFASRRHFLFVGTLEPGKRLLDALRALALLRAAPDAKLIVVGAKGWRQNGIAGQIQTLGLDGRVEFKNYVGDPELESLYRGSLALLQLSSYEGFGLPVIEAMACGCPVIAARNSGLIEAGGDAAAFIETGDILQISAAMARLAADEQYSERLIALGRRQAARFDWAATAKATWDIYKRVT